MTPAIETFGLTKRYGATTAAADLSLRIELGQVFGSKLDSRWNELREQA